MPKLPETSLDFGPDEHIAAIVARPFWKISEALKTMVRLTGGDPRLGDPALVLPLPYRALDQRTNMAWVCCGWVPSSGRRDDGGFNYGLKPEQKVKARRPWGCVIHWTTVFLPVIHLDNNPSYSWTTPRHTVGQHHVILVDNPVIHLDNPVIHVDNTVRHLNNTWVLMSYIWTTPSHIVHTPSYIGQLMSYIWTTAVMQLTNSVVVIHWSTRSLRGPKRRVAPPPLAFGARPSCSSGL